MLIKKCNQFWCVLNTCPVNYQFPLFPLFPLPTGPEYDGITAVGQPAKHKAFLSTHRPCGMLLSLTYGTDIAALRATALFVLMHSGIVIGYQLLFDAHTVLEPHMGTTVFFSFHSLSSFSTFSFYVFVTMAVPISFLVYLLYFVLPIYRGKQIVL